MRCIHIYIIWITAIVHPNAQCPIKGSITDITEDPIQYAHVLVVSKADSSVMKFAFTDSKGFFSIDVDSSIINTGYIRISYLGYKDYTVDPIICDSLNCILQSSPVQIKEVVIRAHPIEVMGDTISYDARAFRKQSDLVLADLLSHMPGIEVSPNGRIKYQGESINKFYIEGLDLMGGRYGLVNNALRANDVASVQILKNHQPIKVLEDIEISDRAAISIKLKSKFSGAVSYDLGVGASKILSDINVSPMLFNKKVQTLNTISHNNAGKSLEHITIDYYDLIKTINDKIIEDSNKEINVIELLQPPINKKYWLDNSSLAISSNGLVNLDKKGIVKINVSYVDQKNDVVGSRAATFDRIQDVLTINEIYNNNNQKDILNIEGTYEQNESQVYVKNNLSITQNNSHMDGDISGDTFLKNEINADNIRLKNRFQSYISLGSNLYNVSFLTDYQKSNQNLQFNTSDSDLLQELTNKKIDISPQISMSKPWMGFQLTPSIGYRYTKEKLQSDSQLISDTTASMTNSLDAEYSHFVTSLEVKRRFSRKGQLSISVPLRNVNYNLQNLIETNDSFDDGRWLFLPTASLFFQINQRNDLSMSYDRSISYASIDHYTTQNIFYSYRDIEVGIPTKLQSQNKSIDVSWTYANTLEQRFFKLGLVAQWSKSPFIQNNAINENGQRFKSYVLSDNTARTISLRSRWSKKYFKLNTLFRWIGNVSISSFQSINNENRGIVNGLHITNQLDFEIDPHQSSSIFVNFRNSYRKNSFNGVELNSLIDFSAELRYLHRITPHLTGEGSLSYYNISGILNRNVSTLTGASLIYHLPNNKGRISIEIRNIVNTAQYIYSEQDVTIQHYDLYNLRPRQILLRFVSQI